MASIQIFPFFVVIFSCIIFVESTGIDHEISLLLKREETIKFLLQNYQNLKMDASLVFRGVHANMLKNYEDMGIMDPYTHYNMYPYGRVDDLKKHFPKNYGRDFVGKHFLIEYVETFDQFAKTLNDSNEFSGRLKEMAQKMAEELKNLEANNSDRSEPMNFEKELDKLKKIKQKMKEMDKISSKNIFAEIRENEHDENQQDSETNQSELDVEAITYQIYDLRSFENVFQKIDEQFELMKEWAVKNIGLPKQQAKFFAAMELCRMMGEQLRTISENILEKERIAPLLEEITNEMNELRGEMAEKLEIEGEKMEFAGNPEIAQKFPGIFEEIVSGINEKQISMVKLKNDIYFNKYAYLMRKLIGQMAKIIAEIRAEHLMVKGVENVRNSFDFLKEMQKKVMKEKEKKIEGIDE